MNPPRSTAGEAALVIEAYENTHKGAVPTSAQVKEIITSTATDLHDPTSEQGAGLIDSLRAVQAAMNWEAPKKAAGDSLVTTPTTLAAEGLPGKTVSLPFTITNAGVANDTVTPAGRVLGAPVPIVSKTVNVTSTPGAIQSTIKFNVPKGTDHLDGNISWDVAKQPYGEVEMRLVDPLGRYADNTEPSDNGPPLASSGWGHIDITGPTPGTWTAELHTVATGQKVPVYTGPVHIDVAGSKFGSFGSVQPASKTLAPGQSATFTLKAAYPSHPGDFTGDVAIAGSIVGAGALPVILRTMIPLSSKGGSFSGSFGGGNGRPGALYNHTYEFTVPKGMKDLDVGVKLNDSENNIEGVLVDPSGYAVDNQSTVTDLDMNPKDATLGEPTAYTNTMQFFRLDPGAGVWRLVLLVNNNISGASTLVGFTADVAFNTVNVTASNLPTAKTKLAAGQATTVAVNITNTGNTTKAYYVDPRLNTTELLGEGGTMKVSPPFYGFSTFVVPPETSGLALAAESENTITSPSVPIEFDSANFDGAPPYGSGSDPDLLATPGFNVARLEYDAGVSFSVPEVPFGLYTLSPVELGPFPPTGAKPTTVDLGAVIFTQQFDTTAVASTGDPWISFFGGPATFKPLVLKPGERGVIDVTVTPSAASGTAVSGRLNVDTLAATKGFPSANPSTAITWSGDEVAALPYSYTVK